MVELTSLCTQSTTIDVIQVPYNILLPSKTSLYATHITHINQYMTQFHFDYTVKYQNELTEQT